jgi:hypothetical protein
VRKLNNKVLLWQEQQGLLKSPVFPVHRWHDAPTTGPVAERAKEFVDRPNFFELTHVAVGARVIYNTTDCKRTGATNSKQGTVEGVVFGEAPEEVSLPPGERWVEALQLRLDTGQLVTVDRSITKTIHPHSVPVSKHTWPVMLSAAQTGHRAQVSLPFVASDASTGCRKLAGCDAYMLQGGGMWVANASNAMTGWSCIAATGCACMSMNCWPEALHVC